MTYNINKIHKLYKNLADKTRIRILLKLLEGEKSVCSISEELNISQSLTSHQLGYLKKHRIVKCRKEGRHNFYSLIDDCVVDLFEITLKHISEDDYD